MIALAWTYPHFLDASRSPFAHAVLVAGSLGLLLLAIRGAPSPARMEGGGVP